MRQPTKPSNSDKEYFTKEHENAILEFIETTDVKLQNELYKNTIRPVLITLIDKIVCTFKFNTLPNIEYLKQECEEHLIMILPKYDKTKNSKTFSYLSVITKNWFIARVKKNVIRKRIEIGQNEITNALEIEFLSKTNDYIERLDAVQLYDALLKEMESWDVIFSKPNEARVLFAIKCLFRDASDLNIILNKKAVFIYLREITDLNHKQISNILKKFRKHYLLFKKKWLNNV